MEPNSSGRQAIAAARVERKAGGCGHFEKPGITVLPSRSLAGSVSVPKRSPTQVKTSSVTRNATAKLSSARPVNTLPLTKSLGGHRLLLCVVAGSGSVGEGRYRL